MDSWQNFNETTLSNVWLKPYIEMNTKLRKEAKNEFQEDFFKLVRRVISNRNEKGKSKNEKASIFRFVNIRNQ